MRWDMNAAIGWFGGTRVPRVPFPMQNNIEQEQMKATEVDLEQKQNAYMQGESKKNRMMY